jgi:phosphate transport system substrate-binding protein
MNVPYYPKTHGFGIAGGVLRSLPTIFITCLLSASVSAAEPFKLQGSTTVVRVLITPNQAEIEAALGRPLEVVGNGSGKGVAALADGKCEAAMVSDTLPGVLASAEKQLGRTLDPADYTYTQVGQEELVFVVHPANQVKRLTREQLRDIHAGKISNWKDVGGADMPVVVFSEGPAGGVRSHVTKTFFDNESYGPAVRVVEAIRLVPASVAELRNGIGLTSKGTVSSRVAIVETDPLKTDLGIVTKGAPSADAQKLISTLQAAK